MDKQELKHLFEPNSDCTRLIDAIGEKLPQDVPFSILQLDPDGNMEMRTPIERPSFNADRLQSSLEQSDPERHALEILVDHLEAPILIEVSREGDLNKLTVLES